MYPILYERIDVIGTVPFHNGLGVLIDSLDCKVTEERNGIYELTLQYPIHGQHADELKERRILKVKPNFTDNNQLFRIYKVGKVLNDKFTVYARHISYDLSGYYITSGTASTLAGACELLEARAARWTITTDLSRNGTFTITSPSSVRSWFGGKEGSLLDVFRAGEWKYDNFKCKLTNRGVDRGVVVKYAKNLLSLNQEIDSSNVITGVVAYWKDSTNNAQVVSPLVSTGVKLDVPNVYVLDCSDKYESTPSAEALQNEATQYIGSHLVNTANQNITLDFLQISTLKDRVDLCDQITVKYDDFDIDVKAQCISTTWDVLKDRYDSIEIGKPKTNIADTITAIQATAKTAVTTPQMNSAITRATSKITGNDGGYVVMHDSDRDGKPDELLIMDTPDISTANKIWRWNSSGLNYSVSGYSGTYHLVMTMHGEIVANRISIGILSDGVNSWDLNHGILKVHDFFVKGNINFYSADWAKKYISLGVRGSGGTLVPALQINDANGHPSVKIYEQGSGYGKIETYGDSNILSAEIDTTGYGGALRCYDSSGTEAALIGSVPTETPDGGTGGAGVAYLKDLSHTTTINLNGASGNVRCVSLTQTSSRKTKDNIKDLTEDEARKVLNLKPVTYDFKNKAQGTDMRGFIAEEVQEVIPELVKKDEELLSLDYIQIIPYLTKMVQLQEKRIEELEAK